MKKTILALAVLALVCCPLLALAQETLSVYNWGDYIEPRVLELFGDRHQGHLRDLRDQRGHVCQNRDGRFEL